MRKIKPSILTLLFMNGSLGVWMATVMNQVKGGIDWATTTEIVPLFIRRLLFNNKALISGLLNHPVVAWLVLETDNW